MKPPVLRLYSTAIGLIVERDDRRIALGGDVTIDRVFQSAAPLTFLEHALRNRRQVATTPAEWKLAAPLESQEVWAAGVTYLRSRAARREETKDAGAASFYDRVYEAERPELFFKATPHRVAPPGGKVRIRADAKWSVPEPELTLAINSAGLIFGYTIGNDVSARDIEGQNPLYLPQAKLYDGAAALGPCIVITDTLPAPSMGIALQIRRHGASVFAGATTVGEIKRPLPSLAQWLFRENRFPHGCFLMTGTGIVPPDSFALRRGDEIRITIEPVGTLINHVA